MKKRFDKIEIEKFALNLLLKDSIILGRYRKWIGSKLFSSNCRKFIWECVSTVSPLTLMKFRNELRKNKKLRKKNLIIKYENIFLNILELRPKREEEEYIFAELFRYDRIDNTINLMHRYLDYVDNGKLEKAENLLYKGIHNITKEVNEEGIDRGEIVEDIDERIDYIYDRKNHPEKYMGEKTGIKRLDYHTGGLWRGELGMVFGLSAVGKSMLLLQFAHEPRVKGKNVIYFTIEMPKLQVQQRYDSRITGFAYRKKFKFARITKKEIKQWKKKLIGSGKMGGKFDIVSVPRKCTVSMINGILEEEKEKGVLYDLVIIDYLDMMQYDKRAWSEQDEQGGIAKDLKGLAMYWNIPVWTACLAGDTLLQLPGRLIKIKNLIGNLGKKENKYIWSYDGKNKHFTLGEIENVVLSNPNAEVWEVELDNGKKIKATKNHPFMLRNGKYRKLEDLKVGDSLMSFYKRKDKKGYCEIDVDASNNYQKRHRIIGNFLKKYDIRNYNLHGKKIFVHHKDCNPGNDKIDNLQMVENPEHMKIHNNILKTINTKKHRKAISDRMKKQNPMFNKKIIDKVKKTLKRKYSKMSDEEKKKHFTNRGSIGSLQRKNPQEKEEVRKKTSISVSKSWKRLSEKEKNYKLRGIRRYWKKSQERDKFGRFTGKYIKNHKVVSIKFCGSESVYDLTIKKHHNFVLGAGVVVHNTQQKVTDEERKILKFSDMGYSRKKIHNSDLVIGLFKTEEDERDDTLSLQLVKTRDGADKKDRILKLIPNMDIMRIDKI